MRINGYDDDRRAPVSSKARTKGTLYTVIVLMCAFMGFGIYGNVKQKEKAQEQVLIEEKSFIDDPYDPDYWYQDVCFTSKEEIKEYITTMAENPPESGIYFKVSNEFTENNIKDIAKVLDHFDGYIDTFYFSKETVKEGNGPEIKNGYMSVNISYNVSDEKYVYDSIVNSKPLPKERPKLEELKKACENFHKEYIKDKMSDYEIEVAAHDYIVNNCKYSIDDMDGEYVHSSYGALVEHKAVCDGYSRAMALLLKLEGVDVKLVSGRAFDVDYPVGTSDDDTGHMWNQVYIVGSWYNLDVTWDDPIGDDDVLSYDYFNVNDEIFERNHEWDKTETEECNSMDMNYYNKEKVYFKDQESFQAYVEQEIDAGSKEITCIVDNPDLSEDALGFIFEHVGVTQYSVGGSGNGIYSTVIIYIN